ncbi:MAG: 2-oxoacid:acceptor oxidoreductase family protein [Emergencia sp.]
MSNKINEAVEIRWHGRGGQGAKTACLMLADIAFTSGKYVQGFPEYGPERQGAPITAYNRITDEPCKVHSNIYTPDYVVVVDETLLKSVDVAKGIKRDGALIINSKKSPEALRPLLNGYKGKICTVDAESISIECLGKNFPNMPMLGAIVKVSKVIDAQEFISNMRESFEHKFAGKENVIEGNMKAVVKAMEEVEVGE